MTIATPAGMPSAYPTQLDFQAGRDIDRWRPLVHWLLAIPHLIVVAALSRLRDILTLISFFAVLFTKRIPRPLFDATAMTLRYEWRTISYALFLHEDYPPFDFQPSSADNGAEPHTAVSFAYPEELSRWKPLVKWLLAVPHYLVLIVLMIASVFVAFFAAVAVIFTGEYPAGARDFLVNAYRWNLRVHAYVGLLTDRYPPFSLTAGS